MMTRKTITMIANSQHLACLEYLVRTYPRAVNAEIAAMIATAVEFTDSIRVAFDKAKALPK